MFQTSFLSLTQQLGIISANTFWVITPTAICLHITWFVCSELSISGMLSIWTIDVLVVKPMNTQACQWLAWVTLAFDLPWQMHLLRMCQLQS